MGDLGPRDGYRARGGHAQASEALIDPSAEAAFAHQLLLAWAAWTYGGGKLCAKSCAQVLGIGATSELKGHKILSEDQLLKIDRAIAQLPSNLRRLIKVHYQSSEDEPMARRYIRVGLARIQYRTTLVATQVALYARLMPEVDGWRHTVV